LIGSENPYFATLNEIMDPKNNHQWLPKPLGGRWVGNLIGHDSPRAHQSIFRASTVEKPNIFLPK